MRRWIGLATLALVAGLFAVACSTDAPGGTPPPGAIDCGVEDNTLDEDGRRCLLAAFVAGTPATFTSRHSSIEGDPIVRTYLVHVGAPVQITHDARQDRFGSGRIEHIACARLVPIEDWLAFNGIQEGNLELVFAEDGCREPS